MRNTSRQEHFTRSQETSEHVLPLIEQAVAEACSPLPEFKPQADVFLQRRRNAVMQGHPLLRPYLGRCLYELAGGRNWKMIAPALAAIELHNISTYQTNLSFDGKIDWPHTHTTPHNQVMASMVSISAAHALLERMRALGVSAEAVARSSARFHASNADVYLGQYLDLNVLHISHIQELADWSDPDFYASYARRCELMGGGTFTAILIGLYMVDNPEQQARIEAPLEEYLRLLGTGTQMTNDLGDYYLEGARPYSASFMDLRRGRLTLPTYRLLKAGYEPAVRVWTNPEAIHSEACRASALWLKSSGMYVEARTLLEIRVWKGISRALKQVSAEGADDSLIAPLTFARPFLFNTRYLKALKG